MKKMVVVVVMKKSNKGDNGSKSSISNLKMRERKSKMGTHEIIVTPFGYLDFLGRGYIRVITPRCSSTILMFQAS